MDQIEPAPVTWTWQRAIGAWESHAFRREGPGWMRAACGEQWSAAFYPEGYPQKCRRCVAVAEPPEAPKRELTELEARYAWGDR